MTTPSTEQPNRRRTLKIIVGGAIVAIVAVVAGALKTFTESPTTVSTSTGMSSIAASTTGALAWPRLKATNAKSLEVLKPVTFNYPLDTTSSILVKLGVKAENGIGPNGDIVAFSNICQHQGCPLAGWWNQFQPPGGAFCGCHQSRFDFTQNGKVIGGPALYPLPRVMLEYDEATGDIYVVGMGPPNIYGHGPPGVTDPAEVLTYDLQGGKIVTQIVLS